jgi:hypothetical protein
MSLACATDATRGSRAAWNLGSGARSRRSRCEDPENWKPAPVISRRQPAGSSDEWAVGQSDQSTAMEHTAARAKIGGPVQASFHALSRRGVELDAELDGERHQVEELAGIVHRVTTLRDRACCSSAGCACGVAAGCTRAGHLACALSCSSMRGAASDSMLVAIGAKPTTATAAQAR